MSVKVKNIREETQKMCYLILNIRFMQLHDCGFHKLCRSLQAVLGEWEGRGCEMMSLIESAC